MNIYQLILIIISTALSLQALSQTKSFGFAEAVPPEAEKVKAVDAKHFGVYINENNVKYIFDETGVYTVSNIMSSISQEKVRESSKYMVRGDYLFGIEERDSTPYILRDGRYYFGVQSKTTIIGENQKNTLVKSGNVYYINFYEEGNYYPSRVSFYSEGLRLSHFDYPSETDLFSNIENREKHLEGDLLKISLLPTIKEWEKLPSDKLFPIASTFKKQNS